MALEERRDGCINILATVAATSMVGIQAKASALRLDRLYEDYDNHQQIAVSLAEDLACLGPKTITQIADAAAET